MMGREIFHVSKCNMKCIKGVKCGGGSIMAWACMITNKKHSLMFIDDAIAGKS